MQTLMHITNVIDRIALTTAICLLGLMVGLVVVNVGTRYVLHVSLTWSAELARYCMVWSALLAAAVLVRRDEHLAVNLIESVLGPRGRQALALCIALVSMVFFLVVCISGIMLVLRTAGQVASSIGSLPIPVVYAVIPVSAMLMVFGSVLRLMESMKRTDASS